MKFTIFSFSVIAFFNGQLFSADTKELNSDIDPYDQRLQDTIENVEFRIQFMLNEKKQWKLKYQQMQRERSSIDEILEFGLNKFRDQLKALALNNENLKDLFPDNLNDKELMARILYYQEIKLLTIIDDSIVVSQETFCSYDDHMKSQLAKRVKSHTRSKTSEKNPKKTLKQHQRSVSNQGSK